MGIEIQTDLASKEQQLDTLQSECECLFENEERNDDKFRKLLLAKLEMAADSFDIVGNFIDKYGDSSKNDSNLARKAKNLTREDEVLEELYVSYMEYGSFRIMSTSVINFIFFIGSKLSDKEKLENTPELNKDEIDLLLKQVRVNEELISSILAPYKDFEQGNCVSQLPNKIYRKVLKTTKLLNCALAQIEELSN